MMALGQSQALSSSQAKNPGLGESGLRCEASPRGMCEILSPVFPPLAWRVLVRVPGAGVTSLPSWGVHVCAVCVCGRCL